MSKPILNPNSTSSSSPSKIQIELSKILYQHDPNAIRLYDFLNHVKVFHYNSNEFRWEYNSYIEGNLFAYEKQQIINNQRCSSFAFALINRQQHLIQEITFNMSIHVQNLRLFYEIIRNNKREVFCLQFSNENECQRLHAFINQSIINARKQQEQSCATVTGESQLIQTNGAQEISINHHHRQPTPINMQHASTSSHLPVQQSTPVINGNSNIEDPTSSLKRLLNIPDPNSLDNECVFPQQQSMNLLPPSAFQSLSSERDNCLNREHIHNVLFYLVQNNEQFLDIIQQACYTHQSQ